MGKIISWLFPPKEELPTKQFSFVEGVTIALYVIILFYLIDIMPQVLHYFGILKNIPPKVIKIFITGILLAIFLILCQKHLRKRNLKNKIKMEENIIKCNYCGLELARTKLKEGKRILEVKKGMPIKVINKELDQAELICPTCGKTSPIDLGLLRQF